MKEIECNKGGGYVVDLENGTQYYEDKDGNIYRDKEEYLRESREEKLNKLLNNIIIK